MALSLAAPSLSSGRPCRIPSLSSRWPAHCGGLCSGGTLALAAAAVDDDCCSILDRIAFDCNYTRPDRDR